LDGIVEIGVVKTVPVAHLYVGWGGINVPVSASISYHVPFEIWDEHSLDSSVSYNVLINKISHIGNIDPGI